MSAPTGYTTALRAALVSKLDADPYFAALVPHGVTQRPTRRPVDLPAVTFWDLGSREDSLVPLFGRTLHLDVWAADTDTCEEIAAVINGLLDNQALEVGDDPYDPVAQVAYMNLRADEDQPQHDADVVRKMLSFRLLVYDYSGRDPFTA